MEKTLFLQFCWSCFFCLPKFIVWVLLDIIYIIYHFLFESFYSKPILFSATAYHLHSSRKLQCSIIVCVVFCITTFIRLRIYIVLINLFNSINIFLKKISKGIITITAKKVSLSFFRAKIVPKIKLILFVDLSNVIVWVLLLPLSTLFPTYFW